MRTGPLPSHKTTMLPIVPVHEKYTNSYRDCLDVVAREKRHLAQIEALPLEQDRRLCPQQRCRRRDSVLRDRRGAGGRLGGRLSTFGPTLSLTAVRSAWCSSALSGHWVLVGACCPPASRRHGPRACPESNWKHVPTTTRRSKLYETLGFQHEALEGPGHALRWRLPRCRTNVAVAPRDLTAQPTATPRRSASGCACRRQRRPAAPSRTYAC